MPNPEVQLPNPAAQFRLGRHHRKHAKRVREIDVKFGIVTFADDTTMSIERWMRLG